MCLARVATSGELLPSFPKSHGHQSGPNLNFKLRIRLVVVAGVPSMKNWGSPEAPLALIPLRGRWRSNRSLFCEGRPSCGRADPYFVRSGCSLRGSI